MKTNRDNLRVKQKIFVLQPAGSLWKCSYQTTCRRKLLESEHFPEVAGIGLTDRNLCAVHHPKHKCRMGIGIDLLYVMNIYNEGTVAADK